MAKSLNSYQKLSDQLEEILAWFESGELTIEEAITKYEQANKLIEQMEAYLKQAENKVRKISIKFNSPGR